MFREDAMSVSRFGNWNACDLSTGFWSHPPRLKNHVRITLIERISKWQLLVCFMPSLPVGA